MNRYVSQLGKVLVLAVASLLLVGNVFAQSVPAVGAKAYIPNTQKLEAAFYLQNPASQGGLGAFNLNSFEYHVGGVNFTAQILAALGGRGSQLYFSPNGTTMVGYVAGAFTGIPFANAPVMAKACLIAGQCFSSERYLRFASGYPNAAATTNSVVPLESFTNAGSANSYVLTAVPFASTSPVVITKFAGVGNSQNGTTIWNGFTPRFSIWRGTATTTPMQEFDASPTVGNFIAAEQLTITHTPFNGMHRVEYTPPNPVVLPAGQYWITVRHDITNSTGGHNWGFKMTNNSVPVDYTKAKFVITIPAGPTIPWNSVQGVGNPGAVALDFIGY